MRHKRNPKFHGNLIHQEPFPRSLSDEAVKVGRGTDLRFEPVALCGVPQVLPLNLPVDEVADCSVVLNLEQTTLCRCH